MYDIVIKNGWVINGSGALGSITDVGIVGKKIVKIGKICETGRFTIDATGLVVSPGFIDMHTHSDVSFIECETSDSKLFQGVTTEIAGCCGYSYFPSNEDGFNRLKAYVEDSKYEHFASRSFKDFSEKVMPLPKAINWGSYVGHGALRVSVVGHSDEIATDEQVDEMCMLLDEDLTEGAFGLSLGLAYAPGMFSETKEIVKLSKVVAKHGKIVTAHIRNENDSVFEAINELLLIGEISKAHVHISHIKLGFGSWNQTEALFEIIDSARKKGIHVTFEQYPYNASSTGLSAVLPNWVHDGGLEGILKRFKFQRDQVIKGIEESNSFKMGLDRVLVISTLGFMKEADGKTISEISRMLGKSEAETVVYLLENTNCMVPTIRFSMCEADVVEIMKRKDCAVISDGGAFTLDKSKIDINPHPRNFGTFPRFLKLNRENNYMTLEEAIYKMTGLPASFLKLKDRGLISEGMKADISIFDYKTIADTAVYNNSIVKPIGIKYVLVNGKVVINDNALTSERSGEILLNLK